MSVNNDGQKADVVTEIERRVPEIIIGSGVLICSLAWNEAFKSTIEHYAPTEYREKSLLRFRYIYAIVVTLFIILIMYLVLRTKDVVKTTDWVKIQSTVTPDWLERSESYWGEPPYDLRGSINGREDFMTKSDYDPATGRMKTYTYNGDFGWVSAEHLAPTGDRWQPKSGSLYHYDGDGRWTPGTRG